MKKNLSLFTDCWYETRWTQLFLPWEIEIPLKLKHKSMLWESEWEGLSPPVLIEAPEIGFRKTYGTSFAELR